MGKFVLLLILILRKIVKNKFFFFKFKYNYLIGFFNKLKFLKIYFFLIKKYKK